MLTAVRECRAIRGEEVQRLSLFDERGRSLKAEWETLIADATKRLGGPADNREGHPKEGLKLQPTTACNHTAAGKHVQSSLNHVQIAYIRVHYSLQSRALL